MTAPISAQTNQMSPFLKNVVNGHNTVNKPPQQQIIKPIPKDNGIQTDVYQPKITNKTQLENFLTGATLGATVVALIQLTKGNSKGVSSLPKPTLKPTQLNSLWEDISSSMKLKDMSLGENLKSLLDKIIKNLQEPEAITSRGGKSIKTILLYGPPGTGKTTFAKAIAKEFPNSRFATLDVTRLSSKYIGESEKNIQAAVNEICEQAQKNPDTKYFVFIDEIDSVMMVDEGSAKKHSNDVLNEFKRCFTERLGKHDNIITIGATNLSINPETGITKGGKILDKPMLDRFQEKIFVGLPTKGQIMDSFIANYGNKTMVCDELKNKSSERLKIICEFLSDEKHEVSFRTLQTLFNNIAMSGNVKEKVTIEDVFKAIEAKKIELKITDAQLEKLAQDLNIAQ
jgi:SpoVK/Ycf46/Vps4 family AAA+-type ATPase